MLWVKQTQENERGVGRWVALLFEERVASKSIITWSRDSMWPDLFSLVDQEPNQSYCFYDTTVAVLLDRDTICMGNI